MWVPGPQPYSTQSSGERAQEASTDSLLVIPLVVAFGLPFPEESGRARAELCSGLNFEVGLLPLSSSVTLSKFLFLLL